MIYQGNLMRSIAVVFLAVFFFSTGSHAAEVKVCQTEKAKYKYRLSLANLLLRKTEFRYGPAKIVPYRINRNDPTQGRCIEELKSGNVDLVFLPPTEQRLKEMSSIKIDIHNGMLGYRVFLIDKKNKEKFSTIKTLEDLRKFNGGFGSQWGDFKVFALNELPVVGLVEQQFLLPMLAHGRFDYFHRGLNEAWAENEAHKDELPSLMVEETIALVYDLPVYYMFNKTDLKLKERFELGFEIIIRDKSFNALFMEYFGDVVRKAAMEKRTLIRIKYSGPTGLPPIDTRLWLK